MKDIIFNNKVIVIGGNHHNALGVIRSLGEEKVNVYAIIVDNKTKTSVTESKFLTKYWVVPNEEDILEILQTNFTNEKEKPIIITTGDKEASLIDKNLDKLKEKYICPNIGNTTNKINEMMDKTRMSILAKKTGFNVPKEWIVIIENFDKDVQNIKYPCIVKPVQSIEGKRQEIKKCNTKDELKEYCNFLSEKYKRVLVQEYINKDYELGINGCVLSNREVIIPSVVRKIREYPRMSGSSSYGIVKFSENEILDINKVKELISQTKYVGIFDIEFLVSNGEVYFNELNFRNGGNSYASTRAGVNLPVIWCYSMLNKDERIIKKKIDKEIYFMLETRDIRQIFRNKLNPFKWIRDLLKTKAFLIFSFKDIKPFIYKIRRY